MAEVARHAPSPMLKVDRHARVPPRPLRVLAAEQVAARGMEMPHGGEERGVGGELDDGVRGTTGRQLDRTGIGARAAVEAQRALPNELPGGVLVHLEGVQVPDRDSACTCARDAAVRKDGERAGATTLRVHGVHVREGLGDLSSRISRK